MLPEYSEWLDLGPQSASGNPIQPNGQDPASTNQPATKPPGDPDEGGGGSDTFTMTDLARQLMMNTGQYGYTRYQRSQGQPYRPISVQALNAIPDRQLRDWMLYLGSLGGLIPGSYRRPQV